MTDRDPSKASESLQRSLANRETVAPSGLGDSTPTGSGPFTALPVQFGRYRVTKLLGRGAMGTVYLAFDPDLGKDVALKVPKFSGDEDPVLLERFRREARAAGDLNHENICGVYEVGQIGTTRFIAMQYIDGRPLSDYISVDVPQRKVAAVVRKLALGLAQAHARGIVHRDLKPANIMVSSQGEPIIMDFGLARHSALTGDVRATQSGMIVGSPAYMAPEQARGENDQIGPWTDIYGLGTLFFELLTGSLPFHGPMLSVLGQLATQPPPKPSNLRADVDPRLESLCLKMLQKQPQNRPASMTEVAGTLTDWLKEGGSSPEIAVRADAAPVESVTLKPTKPAATPRAEPADGIAAQKQRVTDLLDQHQYGAAIELLEKIVHLRDPRFTPLVAWARPQLEQTRASEQNVRESSAPMCDTAGQLLKLHDYAGAVELLTQVPPAYRSAELRDLLEQATDLRDECDHLQRDIEAAVRTGDTETLPALVRRLYKLKPNNKSIKQLAADLKQYGAARVIARRKGQRRFLDPAGRIVEPQHIAIGVVLVVGLFVGVSLMLSNYLKSLKVPPPSPQPAEIVPPKPRPHEGPSGGTGNELASPITPAATGQVLLTLKGHTGAVLSVAFSVDGKRLASAGGTFPQPGEVKVWDATSGQETLTLKGHTGLVTSVVFSSDGKRLAAASFDQTVKVWDATSGQETLTLKGHTGPVRSVAFSVDGKRLASASDDRTVKVWDAMSGQETLKLKLKVPTGGFYSVAFSPDGKRLASAGRDVSVSGDETVKVWDVTSGQEILTLKGQTTQVNSVAFSVDGKRLASAGYGPTVKVWDATSGQETLTLKGHTGAVNSVAFSADGKRLASASNDQTIKVWDATSGQETLTLKGTDRFNCMAFSMDGNRLVSASSDKTVKVWDVTPRDGGDVKRKGSVPPSTPVIVTPEGKRPGEEQADNSLKMMFCWCPPGSFTMGSPKNEPNRGTDEDQVSVTLTQGFWLGKYEVTQGEWQSVMGTTIQQQKAKSPPYGNITGTGSRHPMEFVNHSEATEFCGKVTESERRAGRLPTGWVYRLPSEAEWEYACRAGTTTATAFGNSLSSTQSNFNGDHPYNGASKGINRATTVEVGSLNEPNAWGLHDMHGNVSEWCADWYVTKLPGGRNSSVLQGTSVVSNRVLRGGGWVNEGKSCRSGFRYGHSPTLRAGVLGFRVALGPELTRDVNGIGPIIPKDGPAPVVLPPNDGSPTLILKDYRGTPDKIEIPEKDGEEQGVRGGMFFWRFPPKHKLSGPSLFYEYEPVGDFDLEAEVRLQDLVFWWNFPRIGNEGESQEIACCIHPPGFHEIRKHFCSRDGDGWKLLRHEVLGTSTRSSTGQGNWIKLRVTRLRSEYTFFQNGQKLNAITDKSQRPKDYRNLKNKMRIWLLPTTDGASRFEMRYVKLLKL